ncbi:MAG TPA: acetolactate synthase small subunit [Candidatus Paceibacterota bacterium]
MTYSQEDETLRPYILSVIMHNEPGALARIVGLLSGRGFNINSLTVAPINSRVSRMTLVCPAPASSRQVIDQIMHQIQKLIPVTRVRDLTDDPHRVDAELTILRVDVSQKVKREKACFIAQTFGAVELSRTARSIVFTYHEPRLATFQEIASQLGELGNVAVARGGLVSLGGRKTLREVR